MRVWGCERSEGVKGTYSNLCKRVHFKGSTLISDVSIVDGLKIPHLNTHTHTQ